MIIYLHGSDSFLAHQALSALKENYIAKNTAAELIEHSGDEGEPINWANLLAVPLFASSRLVIIKKAALLNAAQQQSLASFLRSLPSTTIAVVWDGKALPAGELSDALASSPKKIAVVPLGAEGLKRHLAKRLKELQLELSPAGCRELLSAVGGDLWRLETELHLLQVAVGPTELAPASTAEPFIYFRLLRAKQYQRLSEQICQDIRNGTPIELIIGGLAAAVRKEVAQSEQKIALSERLLDIDLGVKVGFLDGESAAALLAAHLVELSLAKSQPKRVLWEELWQESQAW